MSVTSTLGKVAGAAANMSTIGSTATGLIGGITSLFKKDNSARNIWTRN